MLIRNDEPSAKDYLKTKVLEKDDIELLSEFGHYTIEALIVHVLGMVFNSLEYNSYIRVSSLVERLESSVRTQASLLKNRRLKKKRKMYLSQLMYLKRISLVRRGKDQNWRSWNQKDTA